MYISIVSQGIKVRVLFRNYNQFGLVLLEKTFLKSCKFWKERKKKTKNKNTHTKKKTKQNKT